MVAASAGPELPDTSVDVLALAAPVEGTVWFTGMAEPLTVRGHAGITHTWMDPRESERVARRIDFYGHDGAGRPMKVTGYLNITFSDFG